ncbi:hypothetical protein TNCV_129021 [Trichonephila clavipes]|nr:hypothetical protein TNCV_129021 [Trichonephila clavipes]
MFEKGLQSPEIASRNRLAGRIDDHMCLKEYHSCSKSTERVHGPRVRSNGLGITVNTVQNSPITMRKKSRTDERYAQSLRSTIAKRRMSRGTIVEENKRLTVSSIEQIISTIYIYSTARSISQEPIFGIKITMKNNVFVSKIK